MPGGGLDAARRTDQALRQPQPRHPTPSFQQGLGARLPDSACEAEHTEDTPAPGASCHQTELPSAGTCCPVWLCPGESRFSAPSCLLPAGRDQAGLAYISTLQSHQQVQHTVSPRSLSLPGAQGCAMLTNAMPWEAQGVEAVNSVQLTFLPQGPMRAVAETAPGLSCRNLSEGMVILATQPSADIFQGPDRHT